MCTVSVEQWIVLLSRAEVGVLSVDEWTVSVAFIFLFLFFLFLFWGALKYQVVREILQSLSLLNSASAALDSE